MKKIFIGNDHRGFPMVKDVIEAVAEMGFIVVHVGCKSTESADYPVYAQKVAECVQADPAHMGILICGSGIGVCIAANRYTGVRAATCRNGLDATMTRKHNDANIICIGADVTEHVPNVIHMVKTFITTRFEGGRHQRRIDLIDGASTDGDGDLLIG